MWINNITHVGLTYNNRNDNIYIEVCNTMSIQNTVNLDSANISPTLMIVKSRADGHSI